jgi:hypothetical protein
MTTTFDLGATMVSIDASDADDERRVVIVPVASLDRRAVAALHHATCVPAWLRLAVHVVERPGEADELELAWLAAGVDVPLELVHTGRTVAESISEVVDDYLRFGADEVVVVVGRQVLRRRWHEILHDRSSQAIGACVARLAGARPVFVSVRTS